MRGMVGIGAVVLLGVSAAGCSGSRPQGSAGYPLPGFPYPPSNANCPVASPYTPPCAGPAPAASLALACSPLHEGHNTGLMVDGVPRSFLLTLPPGAETRTRRWPVVFNWHGFMDSTENMVPLLENEARGATFPFIMVVPDDTNLLPTTMPIGFDWDILLVSTMNREARLFDQVLGCLDQQFGVDRERVYSVGFSAGSIVSDLLGVLRGDELAAIATYSGAYFSNPANPPTLGVLGLATRWPALTTRNRYPQLLVHGGEADQFSLLLAVASFDVLGANDVRYLNEHGHDVIHCNHGGPHMIPGDLVGPQLVQFFAAHPRGVRSPWATARPTGLPAYCQFSPGRAGM